jgi:hypothetical protein
MIEDVVDVSGKSQEYFDHALRLTTIRADIAKAIHGGPVR